MSLTMQQAVDEILTRFQTAWTPTGVMAVYPDVPLTTAQNKLIDGPGLEPWCRVTIRHNIREQWSFGSSAGGRIWNNEGIVFFEIYTPTGSGHTEAYTLAKVIIDAFEGVSTPNGVWFKKTRANENGSEGVWSRINVTTEFQYDELR